MQQFSGYIISHYKDGEKTDKLRAEIRRLSYDYDKNNREYILTGSKLAKRKKERINKEINKLKKKLKKMI